MSIRDAIDAAEQAGADRPFLFFGDRSWSFGEYAALTRAAAGAWHELGVGHGEPASVFLPNSPEFLAAFHGLVSTGAVMVPINTYFRSEEARYVLEHAEAVALLTTRQLYDEVIEPIRADLPALRQVAFLDEGEAPSFRLLLEAGLDAPRPPLSRDDLAVVLYTSGTTGRPKGCMNPHDHFTINGEALGEAIDLRPDDAHMTVLPLFHQNAEVTCTGALITGCRLVLADRFHPSTFWKDVHRHGVTHAGYLGSIIPLLDKLADPLERNSPLRVFWGAGLSAEAFERLERRWGVVFIEVFGMTETGLDLANPIHGVRKPGSCGLPVSGKNVRVVDENDQEVPPDTPGQIVVQIMPAVTEGYLKNPEATADALRGGWMHTGDMARRDEDGYFYFLDRYKDIIRRSGENVSSAEVEGVLRGHPNVLDAACIPVPDQLRGEEIKAVIVLKPDTDASTTPPEAIVSWCSERLAYFKVPRYVEYREDLERTSTNKVQKQKMRGEHGLFPCYDREAEAWVGPVGEPAA